MDLFIQHLLSQCVVRVRPQQSHVGYSFNVKTDTEAIAVKGRWSIRRGNTWLWRDPRLRAWHRLSSRGSFLEEAVFKLSLERWVGVFQESIIPDRRSSQFKRKCARDVKSFQSIFSYRVALSLRGWAWEQVCPELHWGGSTKLVCVTLHVQNEDTSGVSRGVWEFSDFRCVRHQPEACCVGKALGQAPQPEIHLLDGIFNWSHSWRLKATAQELQLQAARSQPSQIIFGMILIQISQYWHLESDNSLLWLGWGQGVASVLGTVGVQQHAWPLPTSCQ